MLYLLLFLGLFGAILCAIIRPLLAKGDKVVQVIEYAGLIVFGVSLFMILAGVPKP